MINKKITTTWVASVGDWEKEFPTRKEAEKAEKTRTVMSALKELEVTFRQYFSARHEKTSRFFTFCVDCDTLLFGHEPLYGGHRTEVGDYFKRQDFYTLFNAHRCESCHEKAEDLFEQIKDFYHKETGDKIFIDLRACMNLNRTHNETVLMIYKMVRHWHLFYNKEKND